MRYKVTRAQTLPFKGHKILSYRLEAKDYALFQINIAVDAKGNYQDSEGVFANLNPKNTHKKINNKNVQEAIKIFSEILAEVPDLDILSYSKPVFK